MTETSQRQPIEAKPKRNCGRRFALAAVGIASMLLGTGLSALSISKHDLFSVSSYIAIPAFVLSLICFLTYQGLKPPRVTRLAPALPGLVPLILVGALMIGVFSGVAAAWWVTEQHGLVTRVPAVRSELEPHRNPLEPCRQSRHHPSLLPSVIYGRPELQ